MASTDNKPAQKRGSKSASVTAKCTAKQEELVRIIGESVQYFGRKPVKTNEECAERLNEYFQQCVTTGQIPTVEDMALSLGVTAGTLWDWENGRSQNSARSAMIKKAKGILAAIDAKLVSEGKIPQITYIFRAKNFFGMRDQQDVVLTPNVNPLGDQADAEALKQKYLENTYGVAEGLPEEAESPSMLAESTEGQTSDVPKTHRKAQKAPVTE